jgi:hypothetical protein
MLKLNPGGSIFLVAFLERGDNSPEVANRHSKVIGDRLVLRVATGRVTAVVTHSGNVEKHASLGIIELEGSLDPAADRSNPAAVLFWIVRRRWFWPGRSGGRGVQKSPPISLVDQAAGRDRNGEQTMKLRTPD